MQPHRFRYWLTEVADEAREEKIQEGCDLYRTAQARAEQGERTISMDEMTGVQAKERKYPDLPMQRGHVERHEFEYIRHGTLSWFINFDVVSGEVIEPSWGTTRTEEDACAHLARLIASDPQAKKWHLMMDNLNTHQSEALVRLVADLEGMDPETLGVKGKSALPHEKSLFSHFLEALFSLSVGVCLVRLYRSLAPSGQNEKDAVYSVYRQRLDVRQMESMSLSL